MYMPYPPNPGSMLGQRHSLLLDQRRSIIYDAGLTLIRHWVCCLLCANTWHSPNSVPMLTHSLQRWPDIETAVCDCTEFSDCSMPVTMWVTLSIPYFQHQITRCIGPMLMYMEGRNRHINKTLHCKYIAMLHCNSLQCFWKALHNF